MSQFAGQSFLWIENLAYPDAIMQLSFVKPFTKGEIEEKDYKVIPIISIRTKPD